MKKNKIREIALSSIYYLPNRLNFNKETWCVKELYWRILRKKENFDTGNIYKLLIILTDNKINDNEIMHEHINIIEVFKYNDYDKYFNCVKNEKKLILLNILHDGILRIAENQGWDTNVLEEVFNDCIEISIENTWFFKNKYFVAPDKLHYARILYNWDLDIFEIFIVFYDKTKNEIKRTKVVEEEPHWGESYYYIHQAWTDASTFCIFLKNEKKICAIV